MPVGFEVNSGVTPCAECGLSQALVAVLLDSHWLSITVAYSECKHLLLTSSNMYGRTLADGRGPSEWLHGALQKEASQGGPYLQQ
jgi:hypothetical protein